MRNILVTWIRIKYKSGSGDPRPDPHQSVELDPDPHQFADEKPKCMEYDPI
jgi:hypothetical protein